MKKTKMQVTAIFAAVTALIASTDAFTLQKISFGNKASCPSTTTKQGFEIARYAGDWYQVEGIASFFQPADTACVKATYTQKDDFSIYVRNQGVYRNDEFKDICGYAEAKNPDSPGSLTLHFPSTPDGDYWVLDTDYDNWSAVYSCGTILGLVKVEYAFLLTRDAHPSEETITAGRKAYTDQGISLDSFIQVPQPESCTYQKPEGEDCTSY